MACPADPKPFAINKQYKVNMKADETAGAEVEESAAEPPTKKKKVKHDMEENPEKADGSYKPKAYSKERYEYIQKLMETDGLSWAKASDRWNSSSQKKQLLSNLSISELIRRRFCPKGTQANPWAWYLANSIDLSDLVFFDTPNLEGNLVFWHEV